VNGATGVVTSFDSDPEDKISAENVYPIVKFSITEYTSEGTGMTMRTRFEEVMVKYHSFKRMQGEDELASRQQIPLNLVRAASTCALL